MSLQGRSSERAQAAGATGGGSGLLSRRASATNPRVRKLLAAGPQRGTVLLVVVGMILGMLTAYVVLPTEFTGASPRHMSQHAIEQWARLIAVGHSQNIHYDDANALLVLQQIPYPQRVVEDLAASPGVPAAERAALEALTQITGFGDLAGALAPQDPGVVGSTLQVALALLVVAVAVPAITIAGRALMPARANSRVSRSEARGAAAAAQEPVYPAGRPAASAYTAQSETGPAPPALEDETERGGTHHPQYGVPLLQTVSTYVKGRNYDESFAIELAPEDGSQFLGECGVSIATRVGNELQSVEVWGFDMASQETVAKVFAAPAALADPNLQAAVANRVQDPANDIVPAEHGRQVLLESNSILLQAEIKTVVCNYGGGTPNSGIESLQIEILAWRRQGAPMPASNYPTASESPFAEYADVHFTPPNQGSAPAPPPSVGGASRPAAQPQPAKRPEDEEDDPFGGTGNFMPYS